MQNGVQAMRKLLNFLVFQVGWVAAVWGTALHAVEISLVAPILFVCLHLAQTPNSRAESLLILKCLCLGLILDSALIQAGLIGFEGHTLRPGLSPFWMWGLWALFATTLNESMSWLQSRKRLAALLGALFGPLSYEAGVSLGAATWTNQTLGLVLVGIGWLLATPLMLFWAGQHPPTESST
ncbi:MAG: DUF2878 domain-containing protein [Betaproteobacteria bacterium]|nr:DUF2878 domain-containing protein [Betaproteobacteria bacterium]NBT74669.1 DUF2878 domain-containing protein [Betaproteobacteria bacterium]NBY14045.1 DUF2878 domain-containing protein [Betaproteobacteria bacterium]NCA15989.1 DUF2878 domain-containing protein [Betaproteobacteria bacterium]